MTVKTISARELSIKIANDNNLLLLDVREPNEFKYASIQGSVLIPLNLIPQRLSELDSQRDIIVICHHGVRSRQAADYLIYSGFTSVYNLQGGIDAWSRDCDQSVPRY